MKKVLCLIGLVYSLPLFAATTINTNTNPQLSAPQTGVYFNSSGKYAGTTSTVNGATSFYQNGQYQGQAPANNSSMFLNQSGQIQQINK